MSAILLAERRDAVLLLTLNRPDKLNALNRELIRALHAELERAETDDFISAIVVTGSGRAFSAGADIAEFESAIEAGPESAARDFVRPGQDLTRLIEGFRKPVIAAVNGLAYGGGCEIVEAMHMAIASEAAVFSKAEIRIGIIPVFGGTQRLPRHVGRKKAIEMILTGDPIAAAEAERLGLVNAVVPAGEEVQAALSLAHRIAAMPRASVAAALRAVNRGLHLPIDEGLLLEASSFETIPTGVATSGIRRFLDKALERRRVERSGRP